MLKEWMDVNYFPNLWNREVAGNQGIFLYYSYYRVVIIDNQGDILHK